MGLKLAGVYYYLPKCVIYGTLKETHIYINILYTYSGNQYTHFTLFIIYNCVSYGNHNII